MDVLTLVWWVSRNCWLGDILVETIEKFLIGLKTFWDHQNFFDRVNNLSRSVVHIIKHFRPRLRLVAFWLRFSVRLFSEVLRVLQDLAGLWKPQKSQLVFKFLTGLKSLDRSLKSWRVSKVSMDLESLDGSQKFQLVLIVLPGLKSFNLSW